ncbi:MAG TPA: hypothetical protein VFG55_04650 [Rhodanobacteraceae bacterium]|nr:hypothetical protein [Rhodanobacteraceae bacterium]
MANAAEAPLASFEAKWTRLRPEFALALRFFEPQERAARSAFACLAFEIEHTAFDLREPAVAAGKLEWWAGELARAANATAQHPLTHALATTAAFATAPWSAVVVGALAQRDPVGAATHADLMTGYARLYRPLAESETALFPDTDTPATARSRCASRALRQTAALAGGLREGTLPLPLDLLARHQLVRADLLVGGLARTAALREYLTVLIADFDALGAAAQPGGLPLVQAATVAADRARARRALRAREPLMALDAALARLPLPVFRVIWRCARRRRR